MIQATNQEFDFAKAKNQIEQKFGLWGHMCNVSGQ
jgi:hypothetical protein